MKHFTCVLESPTHFLFYNTRYFIAFLLIGWYGGRWWIVRGSTWCCAHYVRHRRAITVEWWLYCLLFHGYVYPTLERIYSISQANLIKQQVIRASLCRRPTSRSWLWATNPEAFTFTFRAFIRRFLNRNISRLYKYVGTVRMFIEPKQSLGKPIPFI